MNPLIIIMDHKERFFATVNREPVDRLASWLGMPMSASIPPLLEHFGARDMAELKVVIDDDIYPVMKFFFERMKIVVEPTGAVAPAAVMKNTLGLHQKKICAVISGGNVDANLFRQILEKS